MILTRAARTSRVSPNDRTVDVLIEALNKLLRPERFVTRKIGTTEYDDAPKIFQFVRVRIFRLVEAEK